MFAEHFSTKEKRKKCNHAHEYYDLTIMMLKFESS